MKKTLVKLVNTRENECKKCEMMLVLVHQLEMQDLLWEVLDYLVFLLHFHFFVLQVALHITNYMKGSNKLFNF